MNIELKKLIRTGRTSYSLILPRKMLKGLNIDPENDIILLQNDGKRILLSKLEGDGNG
jgi:hypothetical protein